MILKTPRIQGGAIVLVLVMTVVLSGLGVTALVAVQNHYRHSHQVAAWQEALLAAEAGVDLAVAELRKTLYVPDDAFSTWQRKAATEDAPGSLLATTYLPNRQSEGGKNAYAEVMIDSPSSLRDSRGEPWYRVRVKAYADVPGGSVAVGTRQDRDLRHIDLKRDRDTQQELTAPRAKRSIEAVVKPIGAFSQALFAISTIDMNNHNIVVDSYDSRDSRYSTNGEYDPAKRTQNGDIATNGKVIEAGNAHIYGDASTNGGTVLNAGNVTGEIYDDFMQESFTVKPPDATPLVSPSTVIGATTLVATPSQPVFYQLDKIQLSGQNKLIIQGAADGSPTYIQITVKGDISLSGQAQIVLGTGVKARIFLAGNADIGGNGFLNSNSPLNLQLYGLERPKNSDGSIASPGTMKIAGNGGFKGTVYAPNYNIEMVGGGNSDSIYGAFVGLNIRMTGVQSVHYDEALSEAGLITDYRVVSWFEDVQ